MSDMEKKIQEIYEMMITVHRKLTTPGKLVMPGTSPGAGEPVEPEPQRWLILDLKTKQWVARQPDYTLTWAYTNRPEWAMVFDTRAEAQQYIRDRNKQWVWTVDQW